MEELWHDVRDSQGEMGKGEIINDVKVESLEGDTQMQ